MRQISRSTAATHAPTEVECRNETPIMVSYGMGVDWTALLVGLQQRGIRPDLIMFTTPAAKNPRHPPFASGLARFSY